LLIDNGADVTAVSAPFSTTALNRACAFGNAESAKLLLAGGADVNFADANGCTSLMAACHRGDWDCAKLLAIENKAAINIKCKKGQTALDYAILAKHDDSSLVDMLARNNATAMKVNLRKLNSSTRRLTDASKTGSFKLPGGLQPSPRGQEALAASQSDTGLGSIPMPTKITLAPLDVPV
jgi:ankyrin repeat protein